jgi:hypothetical protein
MNDKNKKLIREFLRDKDKPDMDGIREEIIKSVKRKLGEDVEVVPIDASKSGLGMALIKAMLGDNDKNAQAHISDVANILGPIRESLNEIHEALQVLSYTNPEGAEFIEQTPVRFGALGLEFAIDHKKAEEHGVKDWTFEHLGRTLEENEDDD